MKKNILIFIVLILCFDTFAVTDEDGQKAILFELLNSKKQLYVHIHRQKKKDYGPINNLYGSVPPFAQSE